MVPFGVPTQNVRGRANRDPKRGRGIICLSVYLICLPTYLILQLSIYIRFKPSALNPNAGRRVISRRSFNSLSARILDLLRVHGFRVSGRLRVKFWQRLPTASNASVSTGLAHVRGTDDNVND